MSGDILHCQVCDKQTVVVHCQSCYAELKAELEKSQAEVEWLQEEDRWHGELMAALVEHVDNPAMCSVSTCAAPATCIGWCRDAGVAAMCDEDCGHGNEDSTCYPVLPTRAEVERLRGRLSKTKDGEYVGPGDMVWKVMPDGPQEYPVVWVQRHDTGPQGEYLADLGMGLGEVIKACYSSREAADAEGGGA